MIRRAKKADQELKTIGRREGALTKEAIEAKLAF